MSQSATTERAESVEVATTVRAYEVKTTDAPSQLSDAALLLVGGGIGVAQFG